MATVIRAETFRLEVTRPELVALAALLGSLPDNEDSKEAGEFGVVSTMLDDLYSAIPSDVDVEAADTFPLVSYGDLKLSSTEAD